MDKIKEITVHIKRWQAGLLLSVLAILLSYILAVTTPMHQGGITMFHLFGMVVSGIGGTVIFVMSFNEMWEKWDG